MNERTGDLKGRVAVVTGSGRGIGSSIAVELARKGSTVVVNMKKNVVEGQNTLKKIRNRGGKGSMISADVATVEGARRVVDYALDNFGRLDVLVNNAGVGIAKPIAEVDEGLWNKQIDTNLKSVFFCSKFAVQVMTRKRYGRIVNVGSVAGLIGMAELSVYSAAKAGVFGLTKSFAAEYSDSGITVNAIAAGLTRTKMGSSLLELIRTKSHSKQEGKFEEVWAKKHSLTGSMLEGEEIASMVAYLAGEEARNITGQVFVIDAGWTMSEARNYLKF